jgi:hypothetical protein
MYRGVRTKVQTMPKSWVIVSALVVATASGAATPIADLIRSPDTWANQTVTIEGKVTAQTFGYGADAIYTVQGTDDYRITVVGRGTPPTAGTAVRVTGTVGRRPPDDEFDFPPLIVESNRTIQ